MFLQTGPGPKVSVLPDPDLPSLDNVCPGEPVPSLPSVPPASAPLHPEKLQRCCESSIRTSEEPTGSGGSPQPPRPDRAAGEEGSGLPVPTPDVNQPEETSPTPTSHARASAPSVTFDPEVAEGMNEPMSEPTAGWLEDSTRPAGRHEGSIAAEGQTRPGSEGQTAASPKAADEQTLSQSSPDQDASGTEGASQSPPDSSMELSELQPDVSRNLMSSAVFLGGIVSLSVVLQEPSTLFFIGLLLVLRRL